MLIQSDCLWHADGCQQHRGHAVLSAIFFGACVCINACPTKLAPCSIVFHLPWPSRKIVYIFYPWIFPWPSLTVSQTPNLAQKPDSRSGSFCTCAVVPHLRYQKLSFQHSIYFALLAAVTWVALLVCCSQGFFMPLVSTLLSPTCTNTFSVQWIFILVLSWGVKTSMFLPSWSASRRQQLTNSLFGMLAKLLVWISHGMPMWRLTSCAWYQLNHFGRTSELLYIEGGKVCWWSALFRSWQCMQFSEGAALAWWLMLEGWWVLWPWQVFMWKVSSSVGMSGLHFRVSSGNGSTSWETRP